MKRIIYTFIATSGIIFSVGCSKDLLHKEPADQSSVETFWTSEDKATAALTGCYETLVGPYMGEGSWLLKLEDITPNSFEIDDGSGASSIARGDNNPTLPLINSRYRTAYEGVGRTNTFLANIDQVPMDNELKIRYKAEAKFLRALYYHNLIEYYGGVPLILESPDNNTQGELPRNTKAEVLEVINADLDDAVVDLPVFYSNTDSGRATKGAALALRARSALYNEKWAEALAAAQAVVDLNEYSLFPDYRGLFLLENERNNEVIFDVEFQFPEITNRYNELFQQGNVFKDLVDAYLVADGQTIFDSNLYDPENPFANRDPRLSQTLITIGSMLNGELVTGDELFADLTGYAFKKYTYLLDDVVSSTPKPGQSEINPILFRYAEILLTIAEAENELNGPTTRAYDAINQVRSRESVDMPDVSPGLDKEEFRKVVRLERRIEFAGEGLYYQDIIRWRTAEDVMNQDGLDQDGNVIENRNFNPAKDYLWPIPDRDILLNPNLEQNPGY
ncbi:RagB/SusD family nutrient uptake outer membrane protein [Pricia sp. S334]|uniref:RagB/SusD family nutrient uptake outer membrane protein n=1 Tax=Pricia mediterranea TaxID=3076079 RepID=A0ABU3L3N6_9FLAO|nr:RagB/SusD family nutrient uptake outer membrane protein [Pricia sp. S334]MDT7828365.1 RagB/SusD family nutrient uptake outer membrane protein [Pricia sp. S334]